MTEGDAEMKYTFEFSGVVYSEPQQMATTVNYGDADFSDTIWDVEKSLYELHQGLKVEPIG